MQTIEQTRVIARKLHTFANNYRFNDCRLIDKSTQINLTPTDYAVTDTECVGYAMQYRMTKPLQIVSEQFGVVAELLRVNERTYNDWMNKRISNKQLFWD